ncbi:MBL fold metallo-hydrolase [Nocardia sp. CDC159]|uniref:MBL fold metallo-hydrolase n=1 Tax=Nocardia pulmonis TaxID=2951408 RepID=A0A9X2IYU6_9NOCA|nr:MULTISPECIES: MBL fold metallo-hydrolase [Nocardia]MCM6774266.1 MBL fold metallo-hydrolase [Nocardia pulmonis]MCM6787153.1 MBL fold metallo-hydrolase [Nocardia sp. CDC159]
MRIHHLNCGSMAMGTIAHCLLIETRSGLVLVDTGYGLDCVRDPGKLLGPSRFLVGARPAEHETAVRQIQGLGYDPADVRHIVLTHLDFDHAGGLSDFPDAVVHVHGPEFRAATASRTFSERIRYRAVEWAHGPKWMVNEIDGGEQWFGFRAVRDLPGLPPEILVIPLHGHTRGHVGVAVDTGSGWLLHAGDAFFTASEVDPVQPHTPWKWRLYELSAISLGLYRENRRRLVELNREHGGEITIFCSHDAQAFARMTGAAVRPAR